MSDIIRANNEAYVHRQRTVLEMRRQAWAAERERLMKAENKNLPGASLLQDATSAVLEKYAIFSMHQV